MEVQAAVHIIIVENCSMWKVKKLGKMSAAGGDLDIVNAILYLRNHCKFYSPSI